MKKVMLIGSISCGKTTLSQVLNGQDLICNKTQTIEISGSIMDTPGEYIENRVLTKGLIVSSVDVDLVLLLQDCTSPQSHFSPGQAYIFPVPTIGIVTKIDVAPQKKSISDAKKLLRLAGVKKIFCLSSFTGQGIEALLHFLNENRM
ncbi:MAG: EutP/PduV family microcompartment system protein [Clostridia bacterium]|nr:EutP/PduV family microcompartment system protein [Clostridia bacterium]